MTSGVAVAAGVKAARTLRHVHPGLRLVVIASESEAPALADELAGQPVVILRDPAPAAIALAVRALLAAPPSSGRGARAPGVSLPEPRSYAHLAGLLPRTLERAIAFDVGVAIVARAGTDPVVDVHARPHCSADQGQAARKRAVSLYRLMRGGVQADDVAAISAVAPFRSSLHAPLVTEGRVAGLTYLASLQNGAFTERDEQVLVDLTTHASGAYRRLESSVTRLRVTPRQAQILSLVAAGLVDKEIAARLKMAHRTVRTHLDRLMHEHGLRSRTEAVTAWLRGQQE
jgi:DNA-binding CsgD family transcriptional regulator